MVIRRWERGEGDDSPTPGRSQPRPRIPLFAPGTLAPGEIGRDKQGNIWLGYGDQEVCLYPPEPASAAPAATTVVVQPTATDLPVQVAAACNLGERRGRVNDFSVKNSVNHCGCCLFSQIAEKIAFWADGGEKKAEAVCLLSRGLLV